VGEVGAHNVLCTVTVIGVIYVRYFSDMGADVTEYVMGLEAKVKQLNPVVEVVKYDAPKMAAPKNRVK